MKIKRTLLIALTIVFAVAFALVAVVACDNGGGQCSEDHKHTFSDAWEKDETYHWHPATCEHTTEKSDVEKHQFDTDGVCKCGYHRDGAYSVTFVADGKTVDVVTYQSGETSINEPAVPFKEHYEGKWAAYSLKGENITVEAVYTPIDYFIYFVGFGYIGEFRYNIENIDEVLVAPQVPEKPHYTGEWPQFEPEFSDSQTVYAQYTAIEYHITFEGYNFSKQYTYTVETAGDIVAPDVPDKSHYTGEWEQYELSFDNEQVIKAVYTAIEYKITFVFEGDEKEITYTVETAQNVTAPQKPNKTGYLCQWEEYKLEFDNNQKVYGSYIPKTYTVTLDYGEAEGDQHTAIIYYDQRWITDFLPQPKVYGKEFWGWFYDDTLIDEDTVWKWDDDDVTLTARFVVTLGLEYRLDKENSCYYVSDGSNAITNDVVIFSTFKGLPVTSIGFSAFEGCSSLTSIIIPSSVTAISPQAFSGCSSLTSITIPSSVTSIGWYAFFNCDNLRTLTFEGDSQLQIIDECAFSGCSNLNEITIPNNVSSIGLSAFENCSSLQSITLPFVGSNPDETFYTHFGYIFGADSPYLNSEFVPNSLQKVTITNTNNIYSIAFWDCSSLTEITIPENVASIGSNAFGNCSSLITIYWNATNCTTVGSYIYSIFSNCSKLSQVVFGENVQTIPDYAFENCSSLQTVTFKDKSQLKSIGSSAFSGCSDLTSITIPSSVTSIGNSAFTNCSNLQTVTVEGESQLQSIGEFAFSGCSDLTSITIPSSVTRIGKWAFSECSRAIIYCEVSVQPSGWDSDWKYNSFSVAVVWDCLNNDVADDGYIYTVVDGIRYMLKDKEATVVRIAYSGDVVIPSQVEYKHKQYPVTNIGDFAFEDCSGLTSVTISNSVKSIGTRAFSGCSNLTNVTIPSSVISLGEYVFYDCSSLQYNTSDYVNYLGNDDNKYFVLVGLADENQKTYTIQNTTKIISPHAFNHCSSLTNITIPGGITRIGESAFYGCYSLQSVTFEGDSQLQSIGSFTFFNCADLTSITIPSSVTSIGDNAFICHKLANVTFQNPNGWNANDTDLTLTDTAQNAQYLRETYSSYIWTRFE